MTSTTNGRLGALAGIGFLALGLLGTAVQSGAPGFAAEPKELVAYYVDDTASVLAGSTMYLIGAILLLWFLSTLRERMRHAVGDDHTLPAIAYAGGVAGAALCMAATSANAMGALRADERGAIDPAVATTLRDLSMILYGMAAAAAFCALVLAVAVAALRTGFLPRWLGVVSIPLGIALAIPPISHWAMIGFTLWAGGVGALLALTWQPVTRRARAAATQPAA